jgi:lipopolysaccharide/colanic/teichoic acid biosynthesis glycosyltransferase
MKRIFDISSALLGLIFLSPAFVIIGLIIKLNDGGSVLYNQKRVGKSGRFFVLHKFRSMRSSDTLNNSEFEPGNVSRVTSIGRFLRRTKIDELPQLINILKGEMSLVGPRPEVEKWVAVYPEKWKLVLTVLPGITDNASIAFRNEESILRKSEDPEKTYREIILPQKLALYEYYIKNRSFCGDLQIIFKTIFSVYNSNNFHQ